MKPTISTLHQSYFKENGKIRFENFPSDPVALLEEVERVYKERQKKIADPLLAGRDLWRDSAKIQKFLIKKLALLGIDLLGKNGLRLLADQFLFENSSSKKNLDTLFGFQPQSFVVGIQEAITFYHPSMPIPEDENYFVLFGPKDSCYVKKESDPANHQLKKMGYAFNDTLKNDTHPLIYSE